MQYLYILECMYVYLCIQKPEEGIKSSQAGATGSYERTCGCGDLNLSPLQEEQMLLTVHPFLQPQCRIIIDKERNENSFCFWDE